jgi:hypothetical protein
MMRADWLSLMFGVLGLTLFRIHDLKEKGSDPQRIGIMVASHNEGTVRYAVQRYRFFIHSKRAPACYVSSLESRHLSKIQNGQHKLRSGQHTLARQKINTKKIFISPSLLMRLRNL